MAAAAAVAARGLVTGGMRTALLFGLLVFAAFAARAMLPPPLLFVVLSVGMPAAMLCTRGMDAIQKSGVGGCASSASVAGGLVGLLVLLVLLSRSEATPPAASRGLFTLAVRLSVAVGLLLLPSATTRCG